MTLFQWNDKVKSQSGLGLSGVLLVTLTVAGGLGCCALIDIPFNAITTQVIPVWVVCMGINPIFVMTQTYAEICNSNIPMEVRIFTNVHAKIPKIIFLSLRGEKSIMIKCRVFAMCFEYRILCDSHNSIDSIGSIDCVILTIL